MGEVIQLCIQGNFIVFFLQAMDHSHELYGRQLQENYQLTI